MKGMTSDEEAQAETLQELMDAMGKMDGRREEALDGEKSLDGMDPRLAEIIRRKRGG